MMRLIALALLIAPAGRAQTVTRGPYLQSVGESSVVIVWRTDVATETVLHYGRAPDMLDKLAMSPEVVSEHEVTLTGLAVGTEYFYEVGEQPSHFHTSAASASAPSLRAWVLGDSGTGTQLQLDVRDRALAAMSNRPPDVMLHVGDIAYTTGSDAQLQAYFFDVYADTLRTTPVWPAFGNHEGHRSTPSTQSGPWFDAFVLPKDAEAGGVPSGTEAYYSFDVGDVHVVVLDSFGSSRAVDGPMLTWLQQDLRAAAAARWLIAYWHHAPYSKGSHDSDTDLAMIEMRENAAPLLEGAGVDLVLAGHSHVYERSFLVDGAYDTPTTSAGHIVDGGSGRFSTGEPYLKPRGRVPHAGTVYAVCGHAGSHSGGSNDHPLMFFTQSQSGSCLLDIDGDVLKLRNIRFDGAVPDDVGVVKGEAMLVVAPNGGEALSAGVPVELRWATPGASPTSVRVEYSADGGAHWAPIVTDVENSGTHVWTPPSVATTRAVIRVTSLGGAPLSDRSDDAFTIDAPPNEAPSVGALADVALRAGDVVDVQVDAEDPEGEPLFFDGSSLPAWASFDEGTTTVRLAPGPLDVGVEPITLDVLDVCGAATRATFLVDVGPALLSPTPAVVANAEPRARAADPEKPAPIAPESCTASGAPFTLVVLLFLARRRRA